MPEPIEEILEKLAPRLREELGGFGYSSHTPDGDDLFQEAQIRLWRALKVRNGEIEFLNSYAKKVVFSVFINEVNRIRRERELIGIAERRMECENNGCGTDVADFVREAVLAAMSSLSRTKRNVIKLRLEGFTLAEIAHLKHWSIRKVCNSYYRGVQELKGRLTRWGITHDD